MPSVSGLRGKDAIAVNDCPLAQIIKKMARAIKRRAADEWQRLS
jgi:hypothetical protein